jgi:Legionella pneumophila major outer membrane protein precursor
LPVQPGLGVGGAVVQGLPRPSDLPSSLFAPSPTPQPGFFRLDQPYFTHDPLLDPLQLPQPGWFAGAEIQVLKPHLLPGLRSKVQNSAQQANNTSTNVQLPSASLDWTVSPRVFLGYRLPSGFGEFMVDYRHLGTQGSGATPGQNGPLGLNSRFAFDILDLDYNSRELSLGSNCGMKWTLGLRSLFLFFDSTANQPISQASAGSGIFQARDSNNLFGIGPHGALELSRRLGDSNFSLYGWVDAAGTFDYTHQGFLTQSTTLGTNGRPLVGQTRAFGHQAAPMINGRVGVTWQPSPSSGTRFFLGYQYEVIFDLDRVPNISPTPFAAPSLGQFWDQGIVLQATFRF